VHWQQQMLTELEDVELPLCAVSDGGVVAERLLQGELHSCISLTRVNLSADLGSR